MYLHLMLPRFPDSRVFTDVERPNGIARIKYSIFRPPPVNLCKYRSYVSINIFSDKNTIFYLNASPIATSLALS